MSQNTIHAVVPRVDVVVYGSRHYFDPLPDISAYELGLCLQLLLAAVAGTASRDYLEVVFKSLPSEAKRHFNKNATE